MTTFLLQVSASTFAQKLTFNKKDVSLKQLFREVKKQTGYNVLWEEGKVDDGQIIHASFKDTPLEVVLNETLTPQKLTYSLVNKTIVIKKIELHFFDKVVNLFTAVDVTGKIIDAETGIGIPQVSVKLKNSNRMVVANDHGTFMFYGIKDDDVLVISAIGYISQEVKAQNGIVIKMKPSTQVLQDVIVSNGYQQIKQTSLTGSYVVVTEKDIQSTPSINLMERLEGKVPGVLFKLRGNSIEIRGTNTFYSSTPPLIVIDGFPAMDQNLTSITGGYNSTPSVGSTNQPSTSGNAILSTFNIGDIESITFLKDAAASAIWGANAANGVIVITTKRGKKESSGIAFSNTLSISAPANFKNMSTMTNREYIDLEQELVDKNFITDPLTNLISAPVSEAQEWMFRVKRGTATIAQRDAALDVLANRSNRDQIKDNLLQKAVTQQYNLSFSGGTDNNSYYVSGSYTKDRPVFKSNSGETYSATTNLTNDFLKKRLTLTTGLNYTYSRAQVNGAALQALSVGKFGLAPYDQLIDDSGKKIYRGATFTNAVSDDFMGKGYLPWTYNAIDELDYNNTITTRNSFRINASLKGKITDWLNVTASGQVQKGISDQGLIENKDSYSTRDLINTGTTINTATKALIYGVPIGAINRTAKTNSDDYSLRTQFNIDKTWNDIHQINVIGGTEIRESRYRGSTQIFYGYDEFTNASINVNTTSTGRYNTVYGSQSALSPANGMTFLGRRRYLSYYGNANYSFNAKYYLSGSVRFDDINILGVDRRDRATPLWSAGLRWNIKKENFLEHVSWITTLSLRATLGTGGNPPTTSNNYTTIQSRTDFITNVPNAQIQANANQDIGWATTKMMNAGLDASLFNSRLVVNLDIFRKKTYGILMSVPVNATYGITNLAYNAGDLSGHGFEFSVSGHIIRTKDWGWSQNLNFSYNTTEVTDTRFPSVSALAGFALVTGYPTDNMFVYRWAGLDNTGHSQIFAADGSKLTSKGTVSVKPADLIYAGRTSSPYFGGFMNTVNYKNLSFLVRVSYNLGHKFLLRNIDGGKYPNGNSMQGLLSNSAALANRWRKPGDEAFTNIPGLNSPDINSVNWFTGSDLNVKDAGNIRLQQISLNYALPKSILNKTGFIKGINLGLTVSNLGLLWVANKEGVDPDYQSTDIFTNLPPTKNYLFNLSMSL
ncbi:SusC/RagA family TonB-linked outer membrane protein [Pedobacter sp. R-06]|uniref:SusC/RagA family TonB-linked outer membrane protein n=1 Tax=Pedobacter sp. R-06 TaxID=3404051 RepID=UPI003CF2A7D5